MFVQLEDASVIKPQAFPNCVAALHRRIERADPSLVTVHQSAVDIDDQVAVLLVKLLEHLKSARTKSTKDAKKRIRFQKRCDRCALCARPVSAGDIHKVARSIPGSDRGFRANDPAAARSLADTAGTMSILPLRRTNISPRY